MVLEKTGVNLQPVVVVEPWLVASVQREMIAVAFGTLEEVALASSNLKPMDSKQDYI